ncbi:MAG: hypothetical protein ABIQ33_04935 [Caldimonas sp.]
MASQTGRSNAEDVDMVHAISDFQNKQSGYDAALKSCAMVQRLSLFQYVNGSRAKRRIPSPAEVLRFALDDTVEFACSTSRYSAR